MDLSQMVAPTFGPGQSHLHSVSLLLGRIINDAFSSGTIDESWNSHATRLLEWYNSLPNYLLPFSSSSWTGGVLPQVWFLQDYHGNAN